MPGSFRTIVLALLFVMSGLPVHGQMQISAMTVGGAMFPYMYNPCPHGRCGGNGGAAPVAGHPGTGRQISRTAVPSASLRYLPTPALQQQAKSELLQRIGAANPESARALQSEFAKYDFDQLYRQMTAPFGLHDDDAVDVVTAYTALNFLIATGDADPSPAAVAGLRSQLAPKLAASAQLNSPEARAKLGEETKLLFVTVHAGWTAARKEGTLPTYSASVDRLFAQQGTSLRQLRLTPAGFAPR